MSGKKTRRGLRRIVVRFTHDLIASRFLSMVQEARGIVVHSVIHSQIRKRSQEGGVIVIRVELIEDSAVAGRGATVVRIVPEVRRIDDSIAERIDEKRMQ